MKKLNLLFIVAIFLVGRGSFFSQGVPASQVFNYNNGASQTFTVPFGVTSITIDVWGAGGAGAGGSVSTSRAGGGGGAYSRSTISTVAGASYTIVVGAGGQAIGNPGTAGGTSSFSSGPTIVVSAAGGGGGNANVGGAGGAITGGVGTIRFAGGNGAAGVTGGSGGGGGGSAGTGGAGGSATGGTAGTAGSGTGGTAGASGGNGGTLNNNNATVGNVPGGGGGGRGASSTVVDRNGAAGANGRVTISYTINERDLSVAKTVSNASPLAGDIVTFTLTGRNNNSTLAASDVILTDLLPTGYTFISASVSAYNASTGEWNIGNLGATLSATMTITAMVNDSGVYNNTASIRSNTMPDNNPSNNTITTPVTVCKGGSTAPQIKQ